MVVVPEHFATLSLLSKLNEDEATCLQIMAKTSRCEIKLRKEWNLPILFHSSLELTNDGKTVYVPIFKYVDIENGFAKYEWTETGQSILEYLKNAPKGFFLAQSVYTVDFYLLLEKTLNLAKIEPCVVEIKTETIREFCQCQNKYANFSQFKTRVIDTALKELQEICKIKITYAYAKNGKHIHTIRFNIGEIKSIQL